MIGLIEDGDAITQSCFRATGDRVLLAGTITAEIGGGEYQRLTQGKLSGRPPQVDLDYELRLQRFLQARSVLRTTSRASNDA